MKIMTKIGLMTVLLTITTGAQAFVVPFEVSKEGEVQVGYDQDLNLPILKEISVKFNSKDNSTAQILLAGESFNAAERSGSKISAYSKNPVRFHYYVVELSPEILDGKIVAKRSGAVTSFCHTNRNALVTAYKGDGTKEVFCATLK